MELRLAWVPFTLPTTLHNTQWNFALHIVRSKRVLNQLVLKVWNKIDFCESAIKIC